MLYRYLAALQKLRKAVVVITTISSFTSAISPVMKSSFPMEGTGQMTPSISSAHITANNAQSYLFSGFVSRS